MITSFNIKDRADIHLMNLEKKIDIIKLWVYFYEFFFFLFNFTIHHTGNDNFIIFRWDTYSTSDNYVHVSFDNCYIFTIRVWDDICNFIKCKIFTIHNITSLNLWSAMRDLFTIISRFETKNDGTIRRK